MDNLLGVTRAGVLLCATAMLAGCTVSLIEPVPGTYQAGPAAPAAPYYPATPYSPEQDYEADNSAQPAEPPPPLPEYRQPPCPDEGWLWTPGYWAYAADGYYWVPGTWVQPPQPGLLWTPGYWAFVGGLYRFHPGYWAHDVGFYGGINYGFGYAGQGYAGGRWVGDRFAYNRAVTNVNVTVVRNTYSETIVHNVVINRVSYNGGGGGTFAAPTAQERSYAAEPHFRPTDPQRQHTREAQRTPGLSVRANGGHPDITPAQQPAFVRQQPVFVPRQPAKASGRAAELPSSRDSMPAAHPGPVSHPGPAIPAGPANRPAPAAAPGAVKQAPPSRSKDRPEKGRGHEQREQH